MVASVGRYNVLPAGILGIRSFAPKTAALAPALAPTAGMAAWWKADAIGGLNDGDNLTTWEDSSANNNDAVYAAGWPFFHTQPTYETNVVNGLPAVRYDSANDALVFTQLTTIRTAFFVLYESTRGQHFFLGDVDTYHWVRGSGGEYALANPNVLLDDAAIYLNGSAVAAPTVDKPPEATWFLLSCVMPSDATAKSISYDRSEGGRSWLGDIAEIILYTSALSEGDRQTTEAYLLDKYGLA